jgi:hypothetical protein
MHKTLATPSIPNPNSAWRFGRWFLVTACYVLIAPWALVAALGIASWLFGASTLDVRQVAVNMATISLDGWSDATASWRYWSYGFMSLALFMRVITSPLFNQLCKQAGVRFDGWYKRAFPTARIGADAAFVCVAMAIAFGLMGLSATKSVPKVGAEFNRKMTPVLAKQNPQASVALQLKDGSIQSGDAEVTANPDGSYLVKFKTPGH